MLDYRNKIIMAPMVRVGTLPMRLLALEYGADIVYTEEIIDWKLLKADRRKNEVLNTIDYIDESDGSVVFQTCDREKDKLVLQIGTADPERALKVGLKLQDDIAAIDINMGCPKEFSIKGGMGAALLHNPPKAKAILSALVNNLKIPVTCKIRILKDVKETVALVQDFAALGIKAIAVHGRNRDERPQHPVHPDVIQEIAKNVNIPVICNGGSKDIEKYNDIIKFRESCGATSVMIARAAQYNCSIFRKNGMLPLDDVITAYLKKCIEFDHQPTKTKYCVQNMLRELQETPRGKRFLEAQTLEQICEIWGLGKECRARQVENNEKGMLSRREIIPAETNENGQQNKRLKQDYENLGNIIFIRTNYATTDDLPKSVLHLHAMKNAMKLPTYETEHRNKLFRSIISFDGKKYATSYWEKNKKFAEQGAAMACLLGMKLIDRETLIENGSILK